MLDNFIPLIVSFITPEIMDACFNPILLLYFIASVPGIIRLFTSWR